MKRSVKLTICGAILLGGISTGQAQWFPENANSNDDLWTGRNVGIGWPTPKDKLHVFGSSTMGSMLVSPTSSGDARIQLSENKNNSYGMNITYDGGDNRMYVYGKVSSGLVGPHLTISRNAGWVGIGTKTPGTKLELYDGAFRITNSYHDKKWDLGYSTSGYFYISEYNGAKRFKLYNGGDVGIGSLLVYNDGDVAIGSQRATGYRLSVNGKIICDELKVALTGDWPDYVFKKDHDLRTINELAEYVNSEQHLPGIPSAEQVDQEGITVGEMQRLLLEKVEELTLYVIDLNEKNQSLEETNRRIQKRLAELEAH